VSLPDRRSRDEAAPDPGSAGPAEGPADADAVDAAEVELFTVAGNDGYMREVNEAFARLLGLTPAEVNGRSVLELVHPQDVPAVATALSALDRGSAEVMLESRFVQLDGHSVHLQWVARPLAGTGRWWAAGRDTTEFHRLLAEKVQLRAQLELAVGATTAAMWDLDVVSGLLTWERQANAMFRTPHDAVPRTMVELAAAAHPDDAASVLSAMDKLTRLDTVETGFRIGPELDLRHLCLRGKVQDRDRRGRPLRVVGLLLDVTAEKAMQEQLLRMVTRDALTGVPNRRAFDHALRSEWRRCKRSLEPLSIAMIDVDDFKGFNDSYGHLVGDEALCAVVRALSSAVHREGDLLARYGGEEFALVLPRTDETGALAVAQRMVDSVSGIVLRQAAVRAVTVSVGTATWLPALEQLTAAAVLARADRTLYAAKAAGKNRAVGYAQSLAAQDEFEAAIARSLADGDFELHYQPVVALGTGQVSGFEALIRWNRPGHGRVPPDQFIPVAETSDLICDLGRWVLGEATRQMARWSRDGLDPDGTLRVAINISGRHLTDPTIVDDVRRALAENHIAAHRLELEITETTLTDTAHALARLTGLRALGVSTAIDDFGTGYTSIGQLPTLPFDTLKIDRSFVAATHENHRSLTALMIEAAHAFQLTVIAEGVEDTDTLHALRGLGCDSAQGYLLARPMPAADVPAWLTTWNNHTRSALLPDTAEPHAHLVSAVP